MWPGRYQWGSTAAFLAASEQPQHQSSLPRCRGSAGDVSACWMLRGRLTLSPLELLQMSNEQLAANGREPHPPIGRRAGPFAPPFARAHPAPSLTCPVHVGATEHHKKGSVFALLAQLEWGGCSACCPRSTAVGWHATPTTRCCSILCSRERISLLPSERDASRSEPAHDLMARFCRVPVAW